MLGAGGPMRRSLKDTPARRVASRCMAFFACAESCRKSRNQAARVSRRGPAQGEPVCPDF
eukprot:4451106-Prymnesium_polylepis.1